MPTVAFSSIRQSWIRQTIFFLSLFFALLLIVVTLRALREFQDYRHLVLPKLFLFSVSYITLIILGWISFKKVGAIFFAVVGTGVLALNLIVTGRHEFLWMAPNFYIVIGLLQWLSNKYNNEVVVREVEIEKQLAEKNDIELAFIEKGKGISVCFEKYSTYYNLRRLADELSTSLSLSDLANLIVTRSLELIQRGDWCLLFLASEDMNEVKLVGSKHAHSDKKMKRKIGDLFDFWVLRNRQRLLVSDTQKDFRFDLKKTMALDEVQSAILAPIIYEGKVVGTLRINSGLPETFTTDHLRLLDAISTLASSALSNAMLYQKTEELAIRDSLTNLYVQRYFLDRLAEEHKRSLLSHGQLSLLMCDLDHFKEVNDRFGHAVGDLVLCKVSDILRNLCEQGIVARYGGEEFTVILPQVTKSEAKELAEKIKDSVSEETIEIRREKVQITISIGVANLPDDTLDSEELLRLADERLYQAKKKGRNRVC